MPRIRQATARDLLAVERLVANAYGHYVRRMGRKPGPMEDDYAAHLAAHRLWVLTEGRKIHGILVLIDQPDHMLLDNLAVDPEVQGRGFGMRLLDFAEAEARRRGFTEIRLYTHEVMVENQRRYRRLGWEETHRAEQDGLARVFFRKRLT